MWKNANDQREQTEHRGAGHCLGTNHRISEDYEGTASADAHQASEAIQAQIREYIVTTKDMRLFSLLHLLGQASLRMEQALWPEDYERMKREVEKVLQVIRERIDRARNEPC